MENFASFYREHKERLFSYLMKMTGDYGLSADIMQESFTRCLEKYSQRANPALLYAIARNAVIDSLRRKSRDAVLTEEGGGGDKDQEQRYLVREDCRRVLSALQKLDADERDILTLVVSSGMSYREIARVVAVSEANVKVKVHRARLKLKKMMSQGDE